MYLLAGLGNPGNSYKNNLHNIGFLFIDYLVKSYDLNYKKGFDGHYALLRMQDKDIVLFKPSIYMNLSGQAISKLVNFYKMPYDNIVVIQDDIDLFFAKLKGRYKSGSGGHNGIKNIDLCLGSNQYWRICIGVGRPQYDIDISDWVLSDFTASQMTKLNSIFAIMLDNLSVIFDNSVYNFINVCKRMNNEF